MTRVVELAASYLMLQGYTALAPGGASSRFARLGDRSVIAIEPRPDGRLAVRSERLGTPCLVIRSNCSEHALLGTLIEQVCLLDGLQS